MKKILNLIMLLVIAGAISSCGGNSTPAQELQAEVEATQQTLPQSLSDDIILVAVAIEGDCVYYDYDVTDQATVLNAPGKRDDLQASLTEAVSDKQFARFVQLIVANGKSLGYRYRDTKSNLKSEIKFTPQDLQQLLGQQ